MRILYSVVVGGAILFASSCAWGDKTDSDEILFVRKTAKGAAVYLMSDDGREVRRLVEGTSPRWSPDGSRFAYVAGDNGKTDCGTSLWVMNADSGGRRLIASPGLICALAWAPDGVRLAYEAGERIVVVNTETGVSEVITLDQGFDTAMDWSPDGRELIVTAVTMSWALDLRTRRERQIGGNPRTGDGRWSPDGGRIALARLSPDFPKRVRYRRFIVLAEPDGRVVEQVTRGAVDSGPAWSLDGQRIYFSRMPVTAHDDEEEGERMEEIYALDLETRALRRLTSNNLVDRLPDVRPPQRSLPPVPEPEAGEVVVPDLVGRYVLLDDEERRFRKLGLTLEATSFLLFTRGEGGLVIVSEQVPPGGSRALRGSVVKVIGSDLALVYSGQAFSGPLWRDHPGCRGEPHVRPPRVQMYGDVVRRILRKGMPKERVVSLLGRPDRVARGWSDWALGGAQLGHAPRIECVYMRVEFDGEGRVTRFHQQAVLRKR